MAEQVTNYKCPACTGPLHFVGSSGKLECDYCGSSYSVQEIEALYAQENAKAEKAMEAHEQKIERENAQAKQEGFQYEGENWVNDGMRAYNCPSCGAELLCDDTTAATSCPYCGNPTVVPGQFVGGLKPDYIIPFKLDKEAAIQALKKHYKGKPLLPSAFTRNNHIQEIQGIYVPFWLFDGVADANVSFHATRSHIHKRGDYEITTTDHYRCDRAGSMAFEKIPADGSKKMPDAHMDSIEPYNYEELRPFSKAYLPGFLADKYDVSAQECSERATTRQKNTAIETLRADVVGYDTVVADYKNVNIKKGKVSYAMMPVWMLTTKWKDNTYMFAMNGQTGKLVGDLPIDKMKMALYTGGAFLILEALMALFTFVL